MRKRATVTPLSPIAEDEQVVEDFFQPLHGKIPSSAFDLVLAELEEQSALNHRVLAELEEQRTLAQEASIANERLVQQMDQLKDEFTNLRSLMNPSWLSPQAQSMQPQTMQPQSMQPQSLLSQQTGQNYLLSGTERWTMKDVVLIAETLYATRSRNYPLQSHPLRSNNKREPVALRRGARALSEIRSPVVAHIGEFFWLQRWSGR